MGDARIILGNARIDLFYDYDTVVAEEELTETARRHEIKPSKFLLLARSDKKFPMTARSSKNGMGWEPKTLIGDDQRPYKKDLDTCDVGTPFPVIMTCRALDIATQLESRGHLRDPKYNELRFEPGEFERKIAEARRYFLDKLSGIGLEAQESRIGLRIVAYSPLFD